MTIKQTTLQKQATQKQLIRSKIRKIRKSIPPEQALSASQKLCNNVIKHQHYKKAAHIACFISFDSEISTQVLLHHIVQDKGTCYLPKLKPTPPNRLWFMPYKKDTKLIANKLGIPEVALPVNHAIRLSSLDILLMPLVAFDPQGNRLGMGGGYYDATLAHLKNAAHRPLLYGIAYQEQQVSQLPIESWDFPLDGIFTQNQLLIPSPR